MTDYPDPHQTPARAETNERAEGQAHATKQNGGAEQQRPEAVEVMAREAAPSDAKMPSEVRAVLPELEGEPDEDPVLDAREGDVDESDLDDLDALERFDEDEMDAEAVDVEAPDIDEVIDVDADDLFLVLDDLREMLETQAKEIRGLRREMRELRSDVSGQRRGGGPRRGYSENRGGRDFRRDDRRSRGGFRDRDDRREFRDTRGDRGGFRGGRNFDDDRRSGGFRDRRDRDDRRDFRSGRGGDRSSRSFGDSRRSGGFRERSSDSRPSRDWSEPAAPRDTEAEAPRQFRPRVRADRGWGSGDE